MKRIPFFFGKLQDKLFGVNRYWIYGLALVLWVAFCYIKALKGGDFDVYLDAADKLLKGENIYAPPFAKGLQYYYSVAFALFLGLFVKIPVTGKFLWLIFSSWCIYRSWSITTFFLKPRENLSVRSRKIWSLLVLIVAIRFALYNFITLQLSIFLLWACIEAIYQCYHRREFKAGILLGIAINIKLLPLVILPYLFYRAYYKAGLVTIATFVVLLFLPAVFIGVVENSFLLAEWSNIINPLSSENSLKGNKLMHSLAAVIPAYFMDPLDGFTGNRQLADFSEATVKLLINGVRLVLITLSLYFLRWPPFQRKLSTTSIWWEISYLLLLVPLIFPHQQKYSFWFILPAIAYIGLALYRVTDNKHFLKKAIFFLLLIAISPIIGRDIIGSEWYDLLQYHKLLSIVTLCFIPFLVYLRPDRNSTKIHREESQ